MMSTWFLVLVGVCGLVGVQAQTVDLEKTIEELRVRVQKLEQENAARDAAKVAFSASLENSNGVWRTQGPYDSDTKLVFVKTTTNIGNAYDPNTGIFTAPLKGLYYIRFTGMTDDSTQMNAVLIKNNEIMFEIYTRSLPHSSASNGMTMVLERGDRLWINLWRNNVIFDQSRVSTFSGFLVFPIGA